jgi:hypothetical protein
MEILCLGRKNKQLMYLKSKTKWLTEHKVAKPIAGKAEGKEGAATRMLSHGGEALQADTALMSSP